MTQQLGMQNQAFQTASAPDPNLQRLMGLNQSILDWHTNPNNTVKDIYKNPTIGGQLPVFEMMKKNLDAGRIGRGVIGRTSLNNSSYGKDMQLEDDTNRSVAAGGALEMGLQNQFNNAQSNQMQLTGMDLNRKAALMGALGNSTANMYGMNKDLSNRISQGGWGGFLRGLAGGAASMIPALI